MVELDEARRVWTLRRTSDFICGCCSGPFVEFAHFGRRDPSLKAAGVCISPLNFCQLYYADIDSVMTVESGGRFRMDSHARLDSDAEARSFARALGKI